jgi:tetratricopeptide (TPR) repeat protein
MKTWLIFPALAIILMLKPIYTTNSIVYSQRPNQIPVLMQNHSIEKQLQAEEKHIYNLPLITGQFAEVEVEQLGIDLVVSAFDPAGKQIAAIDSPIGTEGSEPIFLLAEMQGNYTIEITSLNSDNKKGSYKLEIKDLRLASSEDKTTIQAQNLYFEGLLIQAKQQDVENSLKQALNKYKKAAVLYQQNHLIERQAATYLLIGNVFEQLANREEQIKWYLTALDLYIQTSNKKREADIALNLGELYKLILDDQVFLKEKKKRCKILAQKERLENADRKSIAVCRRIY